MPMKNPRTRAGGSAVLVLAAFCGVLAVPVTRATRDAESARSRQGTGITKANWEESPKIIAIRKIVSATNAELKSGAFKTSERKLEYCDDGGLFTRRRIAHDLRGGIPWYANYGEGQDASWDFQYYYDGSGRLRFVYAIARSTNGTRERLRIYFDETGKRVWKTDDLLKGTGCPGCFSAYGDSDEKFAFDPAKQFLTLGNCQEIKPQK